MVENERKDDNTGDSGGKSPKKLRVLLRTFGCQMNVRDSEVICGLLQAAGYALTAKPGDADVILFNTCSVRQHAEDKVWSEIGSIAKKRKRDRLPRAKLIIGLLGCMAQNYKDQAFKRSPDLDFVVGPADIAKIPEIINKIASSPSAPRNDTLSLFSRKIWETEGEGRPDQIYHTGFHEDKEHSYVVISEGCSNFCSYCVVPYARGPLRHRHYKDILQEIEEAVEEGITKITLLGQNVNAYAYDPLPSPPHKGEGNNIGIAPHKGEGNNIGITFRKEERRFGGSVNFIRLLEMVDEIKGLTEFSFVTSHPKDTSVELFKTMQELEKIKKYLHLPVQAGSDSILKLMNRGYNRKFYLDLAHNYRKIVKGGILTTDIIVGFPGETEEDFQNTYDLVKEIEFNAAYIFKYSPRPHTEAANLIDDVPKPEKERRHALVLELQKKISKRKK